MPNVTRDELIEAGARAWHADSWKIDGDAVAAVIDAVEPLIRADERERTNTVGGHRQIRDEGRADMCADLRAEVEALGKGADGGYADAIAEVLALIAAA